MEQWEFDLVVIGAGPGGYVAAIRAAQLGLKVACIEKEPALGGTCLRVGCIPSKALLDSSQRYSSLQHDLAAHGLGAGPITLDLAALLKRKDQVVTTLTKGVEGLFRKNKITRFQGHASFLAPGRVRVEGSAGPIELVAKTILIATGSQPSSLRGVEVDGDRIGTSTEALNYPSVPKHLVVIGAGVIGLELGSVWGRLGAKVTVLEYLPRILPGMDAELSAEAQKLFTAQGIDFRLGTKVTSARVKNDECVVETEGNAPLTCDRVLLAVGRIPNTHRLGLENVGIVPDKNGRIPVKEDFSTATPGIYAIGDVIPGPMLAHKAEEEGIACVEKLVTGYGHVNYLTIPGVVYTHPEFASVGQTEDQLQAAGLTYKKGVFPFRANGRAYTVGETAGKVKVLADAQTDRILGVHILGPSAGDLINEAALAMTLGASSEDLARSCHAHPTLSEALKEAALGVENRTLHL